MKKSIKDIGGDSTKKTFTVRVPENVIETIKSRAGALDMSYSYYVASVCTLEMNHGLLDQFPDPLVTSGDKITAEEALELVKKLQQSGIDLKELLSSEKPAAPAPKIVIPPVPDKKGSGGMPVPQMPQMRTIADLIRINAQRNPANPDPAIDAALSGDTGIGMKMRELQLKATQEERQDRAMRDKILDNLPEAETENTK